MALERFPGSHEMMTVRIIHFQTCNIFIHFSDCFSFDAWGSNYAISYCLRPKLLASELRLSNWSSVQQGSDEMTGTYLLMQEILH